MSDATEADFHAAFEAEVDAALTYAPTAENVREHMAAWLAKCVRLEVEVEELGSGSSSRMLSSPSRGPPMNLADILLARIDRLEAAALEREAQAHRKFDAIVAALHHLMTKDSSMDHAALLALAKTVDGDVDTAVSNYQALATTHATVTDALDDVGGILNGIPSKLAKIAPATAPVSVTVVQPTTAPATTIPVDNPAGIVPGSTVAGASVTTGATVASVDPTASTITLDPTTPTTADHTGDGTETLTVTPPAPAAS